MPVKMIVTDLDSTLLRTDKTISKYTASVFKRCRDKGIKTVFATARPLYLTTDFLETIVIDGLIATNGAFVYANGKIINEHIVPVELSKALLTELSASSVVQRIGARKRDVYYTTGPRNETDVYCDFKTPLDETFAHLSFHTEDTAFAAVIINKYPELEVSYVSGENLYDVGAFGCTKANGVKELASFWGIQIGDIVAFGDDHNDIEMLEVCGVGVAVANAIDEVIHVAEHVCDTNDNDGVAEWLEDNVLCVLHTGTKRTLQT